MMHNHEPLSPASEEVPSERWKLSISDLDLSLDPAALGFRTTDELKPLDRLHGQERALRALEFGLAIRDRGHNIYVSGMTGTSKNQWIQELLEALASCEEKPAQSAPATATIARW
jgi:hypothetical protein